MADAKSMLSLLVIFTVFSATFAQFPNEPILTVLSNTNGLRTFASWCQETYPGIYSGSGVITVFAFNDTSYTYSMPSAERSRLMSMTLEEKKEYVQTFTLMSSVGLELMTDESTKTSINGKELFINRKNRVYSTEGGTTGGTATYVNGARIIRQLRASNGIIHVLERPLSPVSDKNVYQWLKNPDDPTIQTTIWNDLSAKLYQDSRYYLEVVSQVATANRITFFLPSENALRKIPASKIQGLQGEELANYFKLHYIKDRVVYTTYLEHQESFESARVGQRVLFMRQGANRVTVKCGGVTAEIIRGNITVRNGVVHIIDRMFGFVYNTAKKQLQEDAPTFHGLIERVSPDLYARMTESTGINMFVPSEQAFTYIQNLRGVNLQTNNSLIDYIVKLSVIRDGSIEVSQLNGNYDVRQRRKSWYNDWRLVVYNDRNESWVNGGNVRAKITRPDVKTTTGVLQYIDAVLGVPSYDIPSLIYYDDYLVYTYNDLRTVGLVDYLRDQSFDSSYLPPRSFNDYGNGMNNFGQANNYDLYSTSYPNQFATSFPGQSTSRPNNIPDYEYQRRLQEQQQMGQNGQQNNNPYGQNQYGQTNDPYGQNQNNQYGQNQYGQNQQNQYGQNQYGQNQYGNQNSQSSSYYGTCGSSVNVCQFTFFVPNGTAIYNYYMTSLGNQITRDLTRYRWVLRRLIIPNQLIFIEQLPVSSQSYRYTAHNGDQVILRKETENTVRLSWSGMSARVIMSDLGATNGVVHIIDTVLSQLSDRTVDVSASTVPSGNFCFFGLLAVAVCILQKFLR